MCPRKSQDEAIGLRSLMMMVKMITDQNISRRKKLRTQIHGVERSIHRCHSFSFHKIKNKKYFYNKKQKNIYPHKFCIKIFAYKFFLRDN